MPHLHLSTSIITKGKKSNQIKGYLITNTFCTYTKSSSLSSIYSTCCPRSTLLTRYYVPGSTYPSTIPSKILLCVHILRILLHPHAMGVWAIICFVSIMLLLLYCCMFLFSFLESVFSSCFLLLIIIVSLFYLPSNNV